MRNLLVLITLGSFLSGCLKDTCNGHLGNTFQSIDLDTLSLTSENQAIIDLNITALDELPEAYFVPQPNEQEITTSEIILDSSNFSKTHATLYVNSFFVPNEGKKNEIKSTFTFGDRKAFIDCQHPGTSDRYVLTIIYDLKRNSNSSLVIENLHWEELFQAGHL